MSLAAKKLYFGDFNAQINKNMIDFIKTKFNFNRLLEDLGQLNDA